MLNFQYKTFNTSFKVINKPFISKKINKANDLVNVSFINETSLFLQYLHRENAIIKRSQSQNIIEKNVTAYSHNLFNASFRCYSTIPAFSGQITFCSINTLKNKKNYYVYNLSVRQIEGILGSYTNSLGFIKAFHFINTSFFYESIKSYKKYINYTRRQRFAFFFLNYTLSYSNVFRGVNPIISKLLNSLFVSKKFSDVAFTKKGFSPIFYSNSVTRKFDNITNFSKVSSVIQGNSSIMRFMQLGRKPVKTNKLGRRFNFVYPKINFGSFFKTKKQKKGSKVFSKKGGFFVTSKSGSFFLKANYSEIGLSSYVLKLFKTNENKKQPSYFAFSHLKTLLTLIAGNRFSIYMVNARTLSRFAFDKDRLDDSKRNIATSKNILVKTKAPSHNMGVKTSYRFLISIERERISRFRYVAVYIQDLIRISFFSIFLKKAAFLVSFFALTLSKLPRNRKETQFIRFLMKLVKVFSSQRKEILGLRMRFKGRVNRWRRTKHIVGEKGAIPFFTYATRMDYGMAQAITRKGTLGIHFWVAYQSFFSIKLHQIIFQYMQLPKYTGIKKINESIYLIH